MVHRLSRERNDSEVGAIFLFKASENPAWYNSVFNKSQSWGNSEIYQLYLRHCCYEVLTLSPIAKSISFNGLRNLKFIDTKRLKLKAETGPEQCKFELQTQDSLALWLRMVQSISKAPSPSTLMFPGSEIIYLTAERVENERLLCNRSLQTTYSHAPPLHPQFFLTNKTQFCAGTRWSAPPPSLRMNHAWSKPALATGFLFPWHCPGGGLKFCFWTMRWKRTFFWRLSW